MPQRTPNGQPPPVAGQMAPSAPARASIPAVASGSGNAIVVHDAPPPPHARWRSFATSFAVLTLIWAVLTEFRVDALVFGVPAVLAGAALMFLLPAGHGWRLSLRGALVFAVWFAIQSVRGAVDVALRAFDPRMPLRPGFRRYPMALPKGAARVMFLNAITLLPGTLSAEVAGDEVIVHMLDTRADLAADLGALELRIAALFALSRPTEVSP